MVVSSIHPSSFVSPSAMLGQDVKIGPFCVIEDDVVLGERCCLEGRVTIKTRTRLGNDNYVAEGVVLGGLPQHKQAPPMTGMLTIGNGNTIRENVTVHRGLHAHDETVIGDQNLVMVGAHIAHDCRIGNHTIVANNAMLAGHVTVGDRAYLSGAVGVHQYCRVGAYAMVGGQAHITKDVPPFVTVDGLTSSIVGLNMVGLRRAGLSRESLQELKLAYRVAFRSGLRWDEMLEQLAQQFPSGEAAHLREFMAATKRGCLHERVTPRAAIVRFQKPAAADMDAESEPSPNPFNVHRAA
jgi:UDP-N-acetylglucosamine acyltransferase